MVRVKWNAPTIALTVNAALCGMAAIASLSGDDSALPDKMKTGNVHIARGFGHELFIIMCLMIGSIVNNTAQQACPFFGAGVLVSVWVHVMADDLGGGVMNLCIALMHFYFGLIWKEKDKTS